MTGQPIFSPPTPIKFRRQLTKSPVTPSSPGSSADSKCRFHSLPDLIPGDHVRPAGRVDFNYTLVVPFARGRQLWLEPVQDLDGAYLRRHPEEVSV